MTVTHRVRLKLSTKLKTILIILLLLSVWAFFEFKNVNFQNPEVEFSEYFVAEVINRNIPESLGVVSKIENDERFIHTPKYPYEIRVKTTRNEYVVGSFRHLSMGYEACVGVLKNIDSKRIVNYVIVESHYCR